MPVHRTRDTYARNLEIATDTPLAPTVAIISPTPRAFNFPSVNDIPLPSPSSSPFRPDLKPLSHTPPPVRTLSPTSTIDSSESSSIYSSPSTVSSQASHRRRRSVTSDTERRPKKGDDDYIKRPENAFILFRRKCCEDRQMAEEAAHEDPAAAPTKKQRQADLSKTISQQWKSLPAEERAHWEDLAKEKKKEHEQMYPNYVYRPQRVKDKSKAVKKGKGKRLEGEGEVESESMLSFVLPVPAPSSRTLSSERSHGHSSSRRAASAPTPPPAYQTIQLPTVYMPSCPSSPSLVPRISRRTPLPRYPIPLPTDADPSTHFEFLPNDSFLPTSFQPRHSFDANMTSQPSDSFPIFQFGDQFADRNHGLQLQSLTIPRESTMYMTSSLVSPAESITSGIMSPAESIASSLPSSNGPFTPADALSISGLSLASHSNEPGVECVPENVESQEIQPLSMGYGGYPWQAESLWPNPSEVMLPGDFDLNSIPPIELGLSACDQVVPQDLDSEGFCSIAEEAEFCNDSTPGGHDPFATLFAYDNMSW